MPMSPRLLRPKAASGFTPKAISGLSAWYDASVTSSVTLTDGFVSQWSDLSGGGLHLSQGIEANRPATATVNGRTAIDFDGSNDHLSNGGVPTGWTHGTIFCAHQLDSASGNASLYALKVPGSNTRIGMTRGTGGDYRSEAVTSAGVSSGASGGTTPAGVPPMLTTHTWSGSAADALRVNAAAVSGTIIFTSSFFDGVIVGIRNRSGTLAVPMDGKMGELVIYNRVLTAAEIARVESYLATKWGVTLA